MLEQMAQDILDGVDIRKANGLSEEEIIEYIKEELKIFRDDLKEK